MREAAKGVRRRYRVAVDIGGTFTDLVLHDAETGTERVAKVPSTPPDYSRGVMVALEQVLPDLHELELFVHGTTAPLNAFLERKGARTALLTTRGFRDVYKIGRGNRVLMYDLHYSNAEPLVPPHQIHEIDERMDADGRPLEALDEASLKKVVAKLRAQDIESVAVCLLHSYVSLDHEKRVADLLREWVPELSIYPSYDVCREWREYERTSTVALNAYISPILRKYLRELRDELECVHYVGGVYLMQSNGGLIDAEEAESRGVLTLMSGPVGGSVGSRALCEQLGERNLICVDMGGTSFDFSLIIDSQASVVSEKQLGGFPILAPMVDIQTIGAGGGSIAWRDGEALRVGPHSAGSLPGPACYGRGGTLPTVTDANLVLGRIDPKSFLGGGMDLYRDRAWAAVEELANEFRLSVEQMAEGILDVINAKMANAIRSVTVSKGIDPRDFVLVAFGGAGPMHAVALAQELGIGRVVVPKAAGAFSAWGMLKTDIRHDVSQTAIIPLAQVDWEAVDRQFEELACSLRDLLAGESVPEEKMLFERSLDMRYVGQEYFINVPLFDCEEVFEREVLKARFDEMYESQYGHRNMAEEVEIVNLRVKGIGRLNSRAGNESAQIHAHSFPDAGEPASPKRHGPAVFGGRLETTAFANRQDLAPGAELRGPAVIDETSCTTVVPPGGVIRVDPHGHLMITVEEAEE